MRKALLIAAMMMVAAGTLGAQDTKKWYVAGAIMGEYVDVKNDVDDFYSYNTGMAGVGASINRMIGENFSVGFGLTLQGVFDGVETYMLSPQLGLANFTKLCDKLFWVVELNGGLMFDITKDAFDKKGHFIGSVSPVGLEFRPGKENIGIRVNVLNFSYSDQTFGSLFHISAIPSLNVNFRF